MQINTILRPGQNGTRPYQEQFSAPLVCVRYRSDEHRRRCVARVELAVNE